MGVCMSDGKLEQQTESSHKQNHHEHSTLPSHDKSIPSVTRSNLVHTGADDHLREPKKAPIQLSMQNHLEYDDDEDVEDEEEVKMMAFSQSETANLTPNTNTQYLFYKQKNPSSKITDSNLTDLSEVTGMALRSGSVTPRGHSGSNATAITNVSVTPNPTTQKAGKKPSKHLPSSAAQPPPAKPSSRWSKMMSSKKKMTPVSALREGPKDPAKHASMRRKDSLQRKINVLTFASEKINKYKQQNQELKDVNAELSEINGELKEYIDDKNEIIVQRETDISDLQLKLAELERELAEHKYGNSINDILYKIQGDSVSKMKFSKMSAKRVIFINGINHLFYYDETQASAVSASNAEAKCIVVRDIIISNRLLDQKCSGKPWFLVVGVKRKALFIAESLTTRDKWLGFILKSINIAVAGSSSLTLDTTHLSVATGTSGAEFLYLPHHGHGQQQHSVVTSPRTGNTRVMIPEAFDIRPLVLNYASKINNCSVRNTGHTVQINVDKRSGCLMQLENGHKYRLKSFHFHTPAEHTIRDKQLDMELHLVHYNPVRERDIVVLAFIFSTKVKYRAPKLMLNEGKTHLIRAPEKRKEDKRSRERTPVVPVTPQSRKERFTASFRNLRGSREDDDMEEDLHGSVGGSVGGSALGETDDEESDVDQEWDQADAEQNDFLAQFWHLLPPQKTKEDVPLNKALNFDFLFKTAASNYIKNIKTNDVSINVPIYDYVGELRTPPYTKGVQFLISKHTHFVSFKQLSELKKIWYGYL